MQGYLFYGFLSEFLEKRDRSWYRPSSRYQLKLINNLAALPVEVAEKEEKGEEVEKLIHIIHQPIES